MIKILNKRGFLWKEDCAQIIFNPVSVSRSKEGLNIFDSQLIHDYRFVYEEYKDLLYESSKKELLGEIQLVQIGEKKCIMNAFIYEGNKLNLKAFTKTLIELCNLIEEYEIAAAISSTVKCKEKTLHEEIMEIIHVVFDDCKSDVYLYNKKRANR